METWNSRRSPILSTSGIAASSQPLASACGAKILEAGGTAADAAVAMAACCNVLEPCSTGLGGDAFALYFDAQTSKVTCLLGNGATSDNLSLDYLASKGIGIKPDQHPLNPVSGLCVNVPGAASLWEKLVQQHGRLSLPQVLGPAIDLAENGFPVGPVTAYQWAKGYLQGEEALRVFRTRPDGYPADKAYPSTGDVLRNPDLGTTLRSVADNGAKDGFYNNYIGEAIVAACQEYDGVLTMDDLDAHYTRQVEPIRTKYRGKWVYECPPPTHGLAALLALNQLTELEKTLGTDMSKDVTTQVHVELEIMRRAFVDALQHIGDQQTPASAALLTELLSQEHAAKRVADINLESIATGILEAVTVTGRELPLPPQKDAASAYKQSDTVYFCVVDKEGNGCSFINSNYMGFGTGIVPKGCGFTLHNRGHNFSLDPSHINCLGPRKRCYHTIIPALITSVKEDAEEELFATMGVMGGFMQPQGHLQVIRHLFERGLDPQEALDRPRWQLIQVNNSNEGLRELSTSSHVIVEAGYAEAASAVAKVAAAPSSADAASYFSAGTDAPTTDDADILSTAELVSKLTAMGHDVKVISSTAGRLAFGKGQIITRNASGCLTAGSDPRADGCAIPAVM